MCACVGVCERMCACVRTCIMQHAPGYSLKYADLLACLCVWHACNMHQIHLCVYVYVRTFVPFMKSAPCVVYGCMDLWIYGCE